MNAVEIIRSQGVVAIVRSSSTDEAIATTRSLIGAGLCAIEISLVTPEACHAIAECRALAPETVEIGVGTVLNIDDLARATESGASFVVAPNFNPEVVAKSVAMGIPVVPGVGTVTEAVQARDLGAPFLKLFPASTWSPGSLKDVLAALPELSFIPTGGIAPADAASWISAGATAVGLGGGLARIANSPLKVRDLLTKIAEARHV